MRVNIYRGLDESKGSEHSAIKQTGTNTDTRLKILLNSGQLLSAHLWALTSLIFHRHCIVQHHTHAARTRAQISRHESKHAAPPRCVLGLQVSKSRRKHTTATLLIYCQLSTERKRDCGKAERWGGIARFHFTRTLV